jgi:cytoskeleton protein RodZ
MENTAVDIGALLRERREQLGYSLQDAEQHTRIRKIHLESIEKNQFSELPGQVYITGFIRVYARYLALDSDLLLAQLEDLPKEASRPAMKTAPIPIQKKRRVRKSAATSGWKWFVFGLIAVLLLGAAVYFLPRFFQDQEQSLQKVTEAVPEKGPTARGMAPPTVKDDLPLPTAVTEKTIAEEKEAAAPVLESGISPAVVETEGLPGSSLPAIPAVGGTLRMLALVEGSLIIYLDDRKPHEYKLYNGLDLSWKVKQKVMVELGNPGAARFWLNGEELDLGDLKSFQLQPGTGE